MRPLLAIALALPIIIAGVAPGLAADSMMSGKSMMSGNSMMSGSAMMLKPGESMVVMPNGETMTVPAMKGEMDSGMMKAAMPMTKCMILTMGADHKMHMVEDMKMADGKMACAEMSKMAH